MPTLPQKLNYIHWIEDLLVIPLLGGGGGGGGSAGGGSAASTTVGAAPAGKRGLDIGTGASCIYPFLATTLHRDWSFTATEVDQLSYDAARANIDRNKYAGRIRLVKNDDRSNVFCGVVDELAPLPPDNDPSTTTAAPLASSPLPSASPTAPPPAPSSAPRAAVFDFTMCNPPFFGGGEEPGNRSGRRPAAPSSVPGAATEMRTGGGEVAFVKTMIADSKTLGRRVTWYTTLLGKKQSIAPLKRELDARGVPTILATEFKQGRTSRWGLAWSFHPMVGGKAAAAAQPFLSSAKKRKRKKEKGPPTFDLPAEASAMVASAASTSAGVTRVLAQFAAIIGETHGCTAVVGGGGGGEQAFPPDAPAAAQHEPFFGGHLAVVATEKGWVGRRRRKRQKRRGEGKTEEEDADNGGNACGDRGGGGGSGNQAAPASAAAAAAASGNSCVPSALKRRAPGASAAPNDAVPAAKTTILSCRLQLAKHTDGQLKFELLPGSRQVGNTDMHYQLGTYLAHEIADLYATAASAATTAKDTAAH